MLPRKNKLSFPKDVKPSISLSQTKLKAPAKASFAIPMPPPPLFPPKLDAKGKGRVTAESNIHGEGQVQFIIPLDAIRDLGGYVSANNRGKLNYHPIASESDLPQQELAVHKKKIEIVRRWLIDAFEGANLKKYRKLLILSGPAGAGKTATLRVLSKELGFSIIEWKNASDDVFTDEEYDSLSHKFQAFMNRASGMAPLAISSRATGTQPSRQVILLEDLPNLLHAPTLQTFQGAFANHIENSEHPVVLIISDAGSRGEHRDEEGWLGRQASVMDVRTIIPPSLLHSPYVTRVDFNPIARTLMKKGLQYTIDRHFGQASKAKPSRETLEQVTEHCEGDIRSALMTLQFVCSAPSSALLSKKYKKGINAALLLVTKREHSLALFHMLGKVLYNKRSGDPLGESLSRKDQDHERELDKFVPAPPSLPSHLSEFARRGSRVDPNALYADSPIDTSLYSLYLHQNYYQFCAETEECEGVIESLSLIDSMGDTWDSRGQVAATKFYALTLGVLTALPSPVPRLNQKMFKPEYFDHLKKAQQANDAVTDVRDWIGVNGGNWSSDSIRLWLPSVLKQTNVEEHIHNLPSHERFSSLPWVRNSESVATLLEEDDDYNAPESIQMIQKPKSHSRRLDAAPQAEDKVKFWLQEDDIGEF